MVRLYTLVATLFWLVSAHGLPCSAAPVDGLKVVDATSLRGKVMCGYQGWFRCPGDDSQLGWVHWSRDTKRIAPDTLSFELWPDMSDYSAAERTAIFKVTSSPPTPGHFVSYEGFPSDWYLRLAGAGAQMLHGQRPFSAAIPIRP